MAQPSGYEEKKEYLDNQVHGGIVVNENLRAVYKAVNKGLTGEHEILCVLMSLPPDDLKKIQDGINAINLETQRTVKMLDARKTVVRKAGYSRSYELQIEQQKILTLQQQSLRISQTVIGFLDSIGQWWMKKDHIVETSYLSLNEGELSLYEGEENENDDE